MQMDEGDFVRHRARPEWGIGQVLRRGDDRLDVQFPHGLVALKMSVAAPLLERVSKSEAAAARAAEPPPRRTGPASTASGTRRPPASERRRKTTDPDA
jgi:transcription elongation factor GreA-like protein